MEANTKFLVGEMKLSYKVAPQQNTIQGVTCSTDLHSILLEWWDKDTISYTETFAVILLNRANKPLGIVSISEGGTSETIADAKKIMQAALLGNASAIVIAHNHPSGQTKPSIQDTHITQKVKDACKVMDIYLLDHIIVTENNGYFSYADECLVI